MFSLALGFLGQAYDYKGPFESNGKNLVDVSSDTGGVPNWPASGNLNQLAQVQTL